MPADQAAGLRNRQRRADPRAITLIDTPADIALRLAQALIASGQKVLLIDSRGRHTATHNTHFLFGWQQQLAQQGLQTWPVAGVDVLHAPGAMAGDPAIMQASAHYHAVIFDGYKLQSEMAFAMHRQQLVVALAQADTLERAYALIKTLHQRQLTWRVKLIGEMVLAGRLIAAVAHFLPAQSGRLEHMNLDDDAHFRALAARISAADGDTPPFNNDTEEDFAQHG